MLSVLVALLAPQEMDFSKYDPACGVAIERRDDALRAAWTADDGAPRVATFSLAGGALLRSLEAGPATLARDVTPRFIVTTGSRTERAGERYIFFDKPVTRPHQRRAAELDLASVRVESSGKRVAIRFSRLTSGPFTGELVARIHSGSPLLHFEAALTIEQKRIAYIYDFVLEGDFKTVAWKDTTDRFVRAAAEGDPQPLAVRNRVIMAESEGGTIAVFPPPHAFFYPRDYTDNFKFAQIGRSMFGIRQDAAGGPGHKGAFIPWFDAPAGRTQRMGAFLLLSPAKAEETLERVKRYTNGDAFKPMEGRLTLSSHWHSKLTVNEMAGKPRTQDFVRLFKAMNVNLVHLAEFHGDGNPADPGPKRLPQLQAMFDLCRKHSDGQILLMPGEEANAHLNMPAPKGQHPGHWLYLFPKPVYLTLVRGEGVPFEEKIEPYGTVYHAGSEKDMVEILRREKGLAWTAHPRIKASFAAPDAYRDKDWYKDDLWLGGAWKAMPADLSHPRLGVRVLDLLDDMNNWGQRKCVPGEVDCFDVDATNELYGSMNVNYLRLAKMPTADDWSPVLEVLRRGDFFVTTGEVLIHSFEVKNGKISADLEWTFPLAQIEIVESDGKEARRRTIAVPETPEFGRRKFEWPLQNGDAAWVRLEAWDVAVNGAFTQPIWLR